MNILVTGGLGLIGHNVVLRLKQLGHEVHITDTVTDYGIIPEDELDYLLEERLKKIDYHHSYNFDISSTLLMRSLFSRNDFDAVVHLASFPRQKVVNVNPIAGSQVMSEGLINLLELSKEHGVKKFIYISSSMVYGDFTDDVTEDTVCNPQGQYGILKLAGEWLVKDYARKGYFDYTIIRPSAVYGPLDVEDRVVKNTDYYLVQEKGFVCGVIDDLEVIITTPELLEKRLSETKSEKSYYGLDKAA